LQPIGSFCHKKSGFGLLGSDLDLNQRLGSPAHEIQDENDQGNDKQQVDQSAADVKSESAAPEEQKKNGEN
jgi:hypothetical protein